MLIEPVSPQVEMHFKTPFHISSRVQKNNILVMQETKNQRSPASCGIQTHDLLILRWDLFYNRWPVTNQSWFQFFLSCYFWQQGGKIIGCFLSVSMFSESSQRWSFLKILFSIFPPKSRNLEDKQKFAGFSREPYGGKIKLAEYLKNKFDQLLMICCRGQEDSSSSELCGHGFNTRIC